MSQNFHALMQQLHLAAKTYRTDHVAVHLLRLLQLAKMSEKNLGEILPLDMQAGANQFWAKLLETRNVGGLVAQNSARSIYCIVWAASRGVPSHAVRNQAGNYCDLVAETCERYMSEHTAAVMALPRPTHRFAVHQGGRS